MLEEGEVKLEKSAITLKYAMDTLNLYIIYLCEALSF